MSNIKTEIQIGDADMLGMVREFIAKSSKPEEAQTVELNALADVAACLSGGDAGEERV